MSHAPAAQVVVLGMHRSGTSALTGLLRAMGLWAGELDDFPPGDEHNRAGYWEYRGVWAVDEALLRALGGSWFEVADLGLSRLPEGERNRLRERARQVVRELDGHGSWVIKDPRLCLLFPFWRELLTRPFCVLVHRDPLPVARSLARRDGFPLSYGIALWEKHTREALAASRGLPRILVSYGALLADPEATLRRVEQSLEQHIPELTLRSLPAEEVRILLDPALTHYPPDPEIEHAYLTAPQRELLAALADGSALELDPVPPLSPGAAELLAYQQSGSAAIQKAARLQQAVDGLDALVSAFLDSPSWRVGRAITAVPRGLLGRREPGAAERRDRLLATGSRTGQPEQSHPDD